MLLLMIKGAPGGSEKSTVTELSERLQLAQSTVTELVRRAEEAGLLEREQSPTDARVAHLRLTTEGEDRLTQSFTQLATERAQLREAFAQLEGA
jgi:DNA-binding MarR family transcriptional regulator